MQKNKFRNIQRKVYLIKYLVVSKLDIYKQHINEYSLDNNK